MAETTMALSWLLIMILAGVGFLVLGGLVLTVVLLANEKTRIVGIVLLSLLVLGLGGLGTAAAYWMFDIGPPPPEPDWVLSRASRIEPTDTTHILSLPALGTNRASALSPQKDV